MVTTVISDRPPSVNDDPRHLISATARIADSCALVCALWWVGDALFWCTVARGRIAGLLVVESGLQDDEVVAVDEVYQPVFLADAS